MSSTTRDDLDNTDVQRVSSPQSINLSDSVVAMPTKVCCVCGENVSGKPRMKDHSGRYWCYECGMADQQKKHNQTLSGTTIQGVHELACPDCGKMFALAKLQIHEDVQLCEPCVTKRKAAAKREVVRIAAAQAEAEEIAHKQRFWLLIGGVVAAILVLFFLIRTMVS
ncbi:MAG: hypothetical protein IT447_09335 [Phycisphaerales bacterium]|jgi:ribosomal protein S27AE|nr:hypothetical protein [Phycisphaerales bacterium]